jgi:hypothetical protein
MNLFIQIKSGFPVNHPAFEDNLIQVFGSIPVDWEPFIRVQKPTPGVYQILESEEPSYQKINEVWTDVWTLLDMTMEEKTSKQNEVKSDWANLRQAENWSSWILDEVTCSMVPPIPPPPPIQGVNIFWCGAENNWKQAPLRPNDGKKYQFDFFGWQWEEVTSV